MHSSALSVKLSGKWLGSSIKEVVFVFVGRRAALCLLGVLVNADVVIVVGDAVNGDGRKWPS